MWAPMIVIGYIHCLLHSFIGMEASVHELSHWTPFKTRWLNDIFYYLFGFLTWNNGVHFRASHTNHHLLTAYHGLDKEVILDPVNFYWYDYIRFFTFDWKKFKMYIFPLVAQAFGNGDADVFQWDPLFQPDDERRKKMITNSRLILIGHLVLLGVFIYFRLWIFIPLVTFGYFFATFPSQACVMMQHLGRCPDVPDWRLVARSVKMGPLVSWLYWNMAYHIEHHTYAAVPFYNLRKLHKAMAFDCPEPPKGFFRGFKDVTAELNKQEEDPKYCQHPEFPPTAAPPKFSG